MKKLKHADHFDRVGVIGAGAWGTALAQVCARAGREVILQAREPEVVESINTSHRNEIYLKGIDLLPQVKATANLSDLAECELILAVPPAQHMRATLKALAPFISDGVPIVLCAKGVERGTDALMNEVLAETLPNATPAVLSGPSFAAEVAKGLPAAVTLACPDVDLGAQIIHTLATPTFRPYHSDDMIGAEAAGALKNVLAIACGISEGRGLGRNAHAALITRGFAEILRFAVALGAKPETVVGLCGLGDLVLTCSSPQSRNMSVGLALGGGQTLEQALAGKVSVAEGVESAPAVVHLAHKLGVELPICEAVAAILAGEAGVEDTVSALMSRPLKFESAI
ncbi:MAG: glycerol-3-phosphate dehydrogenase [Asticcacaulis sp. 32-58-5]|nr:MAG: glycerol-3-phosphate dehydrogenase [Asticcacaulis sp. 32-58-5]